MVTRVNSPYIPAGTSMIFVRSFLFLLFILCTSAQAENWTVRAPDTWPQFQQVLIEWEKFFSEEPLVGLQQADRLKRELSFITASPYETYATGRFVYLSKEDTAIAAHGIISKGLAYYYNNPSSYHVLFERTGMGKLLQTWRVLSADLEVLNPRFAYAEPERIRIFDKFIQASMQKDGHALMVKRLRRMLKVAPFRAIAFAVGLRDASKDRFSKVIAAVDFQEPLNLVAPFSQSWIDAVLSMEIAFSPTRTEILGLSRTAGLKVAQGKLEEAGALLQLTLSCPERLLVPAK